MQAEQTKLCLLFVCSWNETSIASCLLPRDIAAQGAPGRQRAMAGCTCLRRRTWCNCAAASGTLLAARAPRARWTGGCSVWQVLESVLEVRASRLLSQSHPFSHTQWLTSLPLP